MYGSIHFGLKNNFFGQFSCRPVTTGKTRLFCTIGILILLCACKPSSEPDSEDLMTLKIEDNKNKNSSFLSEIAETVDVIELETNDISLIRSVLRVNILENHYIVYDGTPGVLIFDRLGNFVRRIGKKGQGPGELTGAIPCQVDYYKGRILFNLPHKMVIYDINGNHIEDIHHDLLSYLSPFISYYLNDSLFYIQESWTSVKDTHVRSFYFNIYNYSNGSFLPNIADSLFVYESKPLPARTTNMTLGPFQHNGQVYFFYPVHDDDCYLYVYKNHQFERFAKIDCKTYIRQLFVTDRFVIADLSYILPTGEPGPAIITPDNRDNLRFNRRMPGEKISSFYVYDYKNGRSIDSYKGFIDDFHHSNDTIPIKVIDGGEKFFYTREHDYSEALGTEPNPTLYIGTFKK